MNFDGSSSFSVPIADSVWQGAWSVSVWYDVWCEYLCWTCSLKCMHFRVREPQLGRSGGSMMVAHGAATTNNGLHLMESNSAPFLV
jgi:hypothetical protein